MWYDPLVLDMAKQEYEMLGQCGHLHLFQQVWYFCGVHGEENLEVSAMSLDRW